MWRYDAMRSAAASKNRLPETIQPAWSVSFGSRTQAWDDPLNHDLMTYDRILEPIVMGGRMFVGFNDECKVVALDTETGKEVWTCFTEAPVRLPPVAYRDHVFFTSDDGNLYCADAATGKVSWKFSGAPSNQKALGNRRLTSAWPARGGPVVRDGTVYFASSIWPFMGTFIHALDAETGEVQWVNDSTGAQYIKQPHSAPSFAGVAPQGALVATKDLLLVPGGRSVPAVFNRADGSFRYFEINAGGKGTGGSFLAADEKNFYVHTRLKGTRAFNLDDGKKDSFRPNEPVLADGKVYSAEEDDDKQLVRCYGKDQEVAWEVQADGSGDLIMAGDQLIAAGGGKITRLSLAGKVLGSVPVDGQIERLLAADEKLFAVAMDGTIRCFSKNGSVKTATELYEYGPLDPEPPATEVAEKLLAAGDAEGYALWYGDANSNLAKAVCDASPFVQLAMVDSDVKRVDLQRYWLNGRKQYGRITVHHSQPGEFKAPSYVANMVFVGHELVRKNSQLLTELYRSVRPFGGTMHIIGMPDAYDFAEQIDELDLEQADITLGDESIIIRRVGALPGAADWTHQYGNVANTVKSNDSRVKLPLGVLWFGGSSNMDVLPRHGHGPPEQVVGGRLFIQGMNSLSARDVYTGRVLWKREFEDLGTFDVYYDNTYTNEPLNPKYNQVHIPGANGRGTNYVVTADRVYMLEGNTCHVIDPATGKTIDEYRLPTDGDDVEWGYIGVYEDVLIGGVGFAQYRKRHDLKFQSDRKLRNSKKGFGTKSFDRAASQALVGMDRHTGKVLWQVDAKNSFWHNGIAAGGNQIYLLDRLPKKIEEALLRRGKSEVDQYRIVAIDYLTGEQNWEVTENVFGTWLAYSQEFDLLLQAGASASDRLYGEPPRGMAVYRARDGSVKWFDSERRYSGPCILHNDLIITNTNSYSHSAGAFYLLDGKQKMVPNPVTGEMQPWKLTRAYGCNSIIASENMLTFRSGAAGFYDLKSNSGTGNLGGFKSGCTSNLVAAGGVLNAPDYTRTCSCSYQNQTSLALVHMPELDMWTVSSAATVEAVGKRIERVGLNFGAPGDRRDANGLLWLEYPATAGPSPEFVIEFDREAEFFQNHTLKMAGSDLPWVRASGVTGVNRVSIGTRIEKPGRKEEISEVNEPDQYRIRLLLGVVDPDESATVDIYLQDELVASDVNISSDGVTEEFDGVSIGDDMKLGFKTKAGQFALQGVVLERQ